MEKKIVDLQFKKYPKYHYGKPETKPKFEKQRKKIKEVSL